jgi:HD domain
VTASGPAPWIASSPLLARAYWLAEGAHRDQHRPADDRPFLDHVVEVATLLHEEGYDDELATVGLLHDSVERGSLTEAELRGEMDEEISSLVMALSEDPSIESFEERKSGLREQVRNAGPRALTVFAADKLSDILGLRRGIDHFGPAVEERIGASVAEMGGHYGESVEMIELELPTSTFLPRLRTQVALLALKRPAPSREHFAT